MPRRSTGDSDVTCRREVFCFGLAAITLKLRLKPYTLNRDLRGTALKPRTGLNLVPGGTHCIPQRKTGEGPVRVLADTVV